MIKLILLIHCLYFIKHFQVSLHQKVSKG